MQSSSAAYRACMVAMIALVLSYSPSVLTPDALAQTVSVPSPALGSSVSGTFFATTTSTSTTKEPLETKPAVKVIASSTPLTYPRLVVPALNLNDPIVRVGLTASGAMAVPSGKTNQVGLYKNGSQPGDVGSAVLDAHVFAAFSKLNQLRAGDSIYVKMRATETLHFVVQKTELFALSQITSQNLFVATSDRDLNLITCAGKLINNKTTYDHRLVVYTTLVK